MQEYSCFLHPEEKGQSLEETCPQCGEQFDFPLKFPPQEINGKTVIEGYKRGFYGAIFVTQHPRIVTRKFAVKIIPKLTYDVLKRGRIDFEQEVQLHSELSAIDLVAELEDKGEDDFVFHGHTIPCYLMEMEYVEGNTLADLIQGAQPLSPRLVGQIALDLLDFIGEFQQRGVFHNDLHGYNIKIKELSESEARRRAPLQPSIIIKVLDLGSTADKSKSDPDKDRLGDVHWVAQHIFDLLKTYERSVKIIPPDDLRLTSQLRRVAELYAGRDPVRLPSVDDMRASIEAAYRFGFKPWIEPVRLESIEAHYNAQTLPAHFAPALLYDPGNKWSKRLMRPGPQLLTGMRGCGKTILLRSLECGARAHKLEGESQEDVLERIQNDTFLGLFVSSSSLLEGPRQHPVGLLIHRLFLAFAREAIRDVHLCELNKLGSIDYNALEDFSDYVKSLIPWYEPPVIRSDAVSVEKAISRALQVQVEEPEKIPYLNPRNAFDALTKVVRPLVDIWENKKLLFLLDDVSTRYLQLDNVKQLMSELSIQSPDFGIVITTERQTLEVTTPGGGIAREGRDYNVFDLGEDVLAMLRGKRGYEFVENILKQRIAITNAVVDLPPSEVLKRQSLTEIAREIHRRPEKPSDKSERIKMPPIYWGLDALVGMCVGDIGDILQIYSRMLARANSESFTIDPSIQDSVITTFADDKLLMLAGHDPWLYSHAVAFAQASYNQLRKSSPERLRQYAEIFIRIDPEQAKDKDIFNKIIRLVDEGVFVFTGGTSRTKTPRGKPSLLFKLAFRKLLGATHRIPISSRDRFELSRNRLLSWISNPTAASLELGIKAKSNNENEAANHSAAGEITMPRKASRHPRRRKAAQGQFVFTESARLIDSRKETNSVSLRLLYDVRTLESDLLPEVQVDWEQTHVIAAIGFEDRTIGTWNNLLTSGRPAGVTLLRYENRGRDKELFSLLSSHNIAWEIEEVESSTTEEQIRKIISTSRNRKVLIDTTSLTKALIFGLVRNALLDIGEVWILHTCAAEYYPQELNLKQVLSFFNSKDYPKAFKQLDDIVAGERGPFKVVTIGPQLLDPGQPSFMVAFVALKHNRVERLLETAPVEKLAAIAPLHSAGPDAPRSKLGMIMAKYLAERYGGEVYKAGSLDHDDTYHLLLDLHRRFSLGGGHNFEISLSGTKLQMVGAAMFASVATPAAVYYSSPAAFDPTKFTKGTAETRIIHLKRVE